MEGCRLFFPNAASEFCKKLLALVLFDVKNNIMLQMSNYSLPPLDHTIECRKIFQTVGLNIIDLYILYNVLISCTIRRFVFKNEQRIGLRGFIQLICPDKFRRRPIILLSKTDQMFV